MLGTQTVDTYVSLFVQLVVGEFELVKINDRVHPVRAEGRGFGVHV